MMSSDEARIRRMSYRAWHRGTREADYMIGGFFDRYHRQWSADELDAFEALLEEQDVDIMAWALGKDVAPPRYAQMLMPALQRLDYIDIPR